MFLSSNEHLKHLPLESQLITSEIKSPKLWEQDLAKIVGDEITLEVSVDPTTQDISINTK